MNAKLASILVGSLLALSVGCGSTIIGGGGGEESEEESSGGCLDDCGPDPDPSPSPGTRRSAIALTEAQVDATNEDLEDGESSAAAGGGSFGDRMAVFIDVSPSPIGLLCADPYAYDDGCATERAVLTLWFPTELLTPGTYSFSTEGVVLAMSEQGPNGDGTCWGGGGGGGSEGSFEVVAVDDATITLRLPSEPFGDSELIEVVAARCP